MILFCFSLRSIDFTNRSGKKFWGNWECWGSVGKVAVYQIVQVLIKSFYVFADIRKNTGILL
jgi:hypothetical protein